MSGNQAYQITCKWPGWGDLYAWKAKWKDLDRGLQKAHLAASEQSREPDRRGIPLAWVRER